VRRIPLSRRSHITGFQVLPEGITEHESALERDFVTSATFTDPSARITSQPITIAFRYAGIARRYTPDYLVCWSNGRSELVEVKYRSDLRQQWHRLRPAFAAASAWCSANEAHFRIATDRSIRGVRLANIKRLLPLRTAYLDPATAAKIVALLSTSSSATLASVIIALPGDRATTLGAVWRMIARGVLRADLGAPLDMNASVALA
jgi:hypothetical protein